MSSDHKFGCAYERRRSLVYFGELGIDIIKQKLDNDDQLEAQMRKFGRS
jgi:hypothetical protein